MARVESAVHAVRGNDKDCCSCTDTHVVFGPYNTRHTYYFLSHHIRHTTRWLQQGLGRGSRDAQNVNSRGGEGWRARRVRVVRYGSCHGE